jgi:hypothetical protein
VDIVIAHIRIQSSMQHTKEKWSPRKSSVVLASRIEMPCSAAVNRCLYAYFWNATTEMFDCNSRGAPLEWYLQFEIPKSSGWSFCWACTVDIPIGFWRNGWRSSYSFRRDKKSSTEKKWFLSYWSIKPEKVNQESSTPLLLQIAVSSSSRSSIFLT